MILTHLVSFGFFTGASAVGAAPEPAPEDGGAGGGAGEPGGRRRREEERSQAGTARTNRLPEPPEPALAARRVVEENDAQIAQLQAQRDALARLEAQLGEASERSEARAAEMARLEQAIIALEEENEAILVLLLYVAVT